MTMAFPAPVAADRYDASLSAMVPLNEPEQINKLRKRLMTSRDLATRALSNSGGHTEQALALHHVILDVTAAYVFRLQDLSGLQDAADLCVRLLMNATTLDRLGGFDAQSN